MCKRGTDSVAQQKHAHEAHVHVEHVSEHDRELAHVEHLVHHAAQAGHQSEKQQHPGCGGPRRHPVIHGRMPEANRRSTLSAANPPLAVAPLDGLPLTAPWNRYIYHSRGGPSSRSPAAPTGSHGTEWKNESAQRRAGGFVRLDPMGTAAQGIRSRSPGPV